MYSDDWLRMGYKNGGPIEIVNNAGYQNTKSLLGVDYKIWIDSKESIIGVSVGFSRDIDEFYYDLSIEEWLKFLKMILKSSDFGESQKLFSKFIRENEEDAFAFQHSLDFHEIKYDKIAFYDIE
jgi:hypothetical protein